MSYLLIPIFDFTFEQKTENSRMSFRFIIFGELTENNVSNFISFTVFFFFSVIHICQSFSLRLFIRNLLCEMKLLAL